MNKSYLRLLTCVMVLCLLTPAAAAQAGDKSLASLLQTVWLPMSMQPNYQERGWKSWEVVGMHWNELIAGSTGADSSRANLVIALRDSLPLLALVAPEQSKRYRYLKIDGFLTGGWQISMQASAETGQPECIEFSQGNEKVFFFSQPDGKGLYFMVMPLADGNYILLSWDKNGEAFEHILIYDPRKRSIQACGQFALHPSSMTYLFVKTNQEDWLELTFHEARPEPVAMALHDQLPGNLRSMLLDLDHDGKMDIFSETADASAALIIRNIAVAEPLYHPEMLIHYKQAMVEQALRTNAIWLKIQSLWPQLDPLSLRLPEIIRL